MIDMGDMQTDLLEKVLALLPLHDLLGMRKAGPFLRETVDRLCRETRGGLRAVDGDPANGIKFTEKALTTAVSQAGRPEWLCWALHASWLHHVVCVGSADAVKYAVALGEDVESLPDTQRINAVHRLSCMTLTPLMLACAMGRTVVAEALLEVSGSSRLEEEEKFGWRNSGLDACVGIWVARRRYGTTLAALSHIDCVMYLPL